MKRTNLLLLVLLLVLTLQRSANSQQSPHDPEGGYFSMYHDVMLEDDFVTALGIGEEDYDGWGHFVTLTTNVSGANNQTATDSATAKFFICAEASIQIQSGDDGRYYISSVADWFCPYIGDGLTAGAEDWFDLYTSLRTTYYKDPLPAFHGCDYYAFNCFSGTPTCGTTLPQHVTEVLPCEPTTKIESLYFRVVFYNSVFAVCSPGISFPGAGTGICT